YIVSIKGMVRIMTRKFLQKYLLIAKEHSILQIVLIARQQLLSLASETLTPRRLFGVQMSFDNTKELNLSHMSAP
ncbi:hypothetical protein N8083_00995, partial [Candidatus Pacebacteria bacterium]|nr:hypothetical protein [Candidatus Paceibacterota bacterium]